jgi:hypothetical protein
MNRYWKRSPNGLYLPVEKHEGVILSSGLLIPVKLPPVLIEALNKLIHPPDEEEWQEHELTEVTLKLRAGIAYEFLLKQFGVPIPGWKAPIHPDIDELIFLHGFLWVAAWKMLDWLNSHGYLNLPSAELYCLIGEMVLLTPFVVHREDSESKAANTCIGEVQSQNRVLQDRKNPFSVKRYPHTHRIVGAALAIAVLNEDFYTDLFLPVVRSRMSCVTTVDSNKPKSFDLDGRMEQRGRKPKKQKLSRGRPTNCKVMQI